MAKIGDTLAGMADCAAVAGAVKAEGLMDTLNSGDRGAWTLFVPTDAAVAKLPAGTAVTADVLKYHLVEGEKQPSRNGITYDTVQGKEISVKVTVDTADSFMWGGNPEPALVINGCRNGISCDNGVIHLIDQVLLPYEGDEAPIHN